MGVHNSSKKHSISALNINLTEHTIFRSDNTGLYRSETVC